MGLSCTLNCSLIFLMGLDIGRQNYCYPWTISLYHEVEMMIIGSDSDDDFVDYGDNDYDNNDHDSLLV